MAHPEYMGAMYTNSSGALGYGVMRLMQFNERLNAFDGIPRDIAYWKKFVHDFFTEQGVFRYTAIVDNQQGQKSTKSFDVSVAALPRFFYLAHTETLKSMYFILGRTQEFLTATNGYFVEASQAQYVCEYASGVQVVTKGCIRAVLSRAQSLKLDLFEFTFNSYSEYLMRDLVLSAANAARTASQSRPVNIEDFFPKTTVNEIGLEPRVMRYMEITETISSMRDLIAFSVAQRSSPMHAINKFAKLVQQQHLFENNVNGAGAPSPMLMRGLGSATSNTSDAASQGQMVSQNAQQGANKSTAATAMPPASVDMSQAGGMPMTMHSPSLINAYQQQVPPGNTAGGSLMSPHQKRRFPQSPGIHVSSNEMPHDNSDPNYQRKRPKQ
ncbi:adhesion defective protein [Schizosaccharomyces japonicus yFS275]|uniref:Adhesion defective protein n=1 Tax=Schizosaccharomyces japonicus (strain yFS275 / FY16936) TaxID=402676 RepID=B6K1Z3_SCHJY|nr:adhesion defective protein [Schizosaccharomyces japonicus yFS275]EEB07174.1 adhesion defective protein [Schizosaccharomyces japonicus yFS275]